jgi:tRNA C32,U32 (ribose-2'-O)-methylase TrmJ
MTPSSSPNLPPRVVLVGTQHPGNIGSAARAMKTMGLHELALVAPMRFPDSEANSLAAGARDVLENASVYDTPREDAELPATHAEMESFFAHLGGFLDEIDFHKGKDPGMVTQRLRRLFLRAGPDARELRILRGILSDTQRLLGGG